MALPAFVIPMIIGAAGKAVDTVANFGAINDPNKTTIGSDVANIATNVLAKGDDHKENELARELVRQAAEAEVDSDGNIKNDLTRKFVDWYLDEYLGKHATIKLPADAAGLDTLFDEDSEDSPFGRAMLKLYGKYIKNKLYQYTPEGVARGNPTEPQIGPTAQEIEQVNPAVVNEDADGVKSVDTGRLALMNAGAIADLERKIETLEDVMNDVAQGGVLSDEHFKIIADNPKDLPPAMKVLLNRDDVNECTDAMAQLVRMCTYHLCDGEPDDAYWDRALEYIVTYDPEGAAKAVEKIVEPDAAAQKEALINAISRRYV